ncbi:hypothetical protein RND81_04G024300 [Saponaria officinalis]|uniref:Luc7-like protein 3 n=1 Tax=Saponaria officinalis TaxID=3572 RepID=A0AAW1LGW2_SAPOF
MDAQRALLDELIGAARNLTDEEKKWYRELKWDDKEVCACFMVRFCPHDLFVNTRSDLGALFGSFYQCFSLYCLYEQM